MQDLELKNSLFHILSPPSGERRTNLNSSINRTLAHTSFVQLKCWRANWRRKERCLGVKIGAVADLDTSSDSLRRRPETYVPLTSLSKALLNLCCCSSPIVQYLHTHKSIISPRWSYPSVRFRPLGIRISFSKLSYSPIVYFHPLIQVL